MVEKINNLLKVLFPPCGYFESSREDYRDYEAEQRGHEASRRLYEAPAKLESEGEDG